MVRDSSLETARCARGCGAATRLKLRNKGLVGQACKHKADKDTLFPLSDTEWNL